MFSRKSADSLEIFLIGNSPEEKLSGGARINNWINILKLNGMKINLFGYYVYSDKLKIEYRTIDESLRTTTIYFPKDWPRFLKAFLLLVFNFIYPWKYTKTSNLIFYGGGTALLLLPMILVSKLRNKPIIFDYLDLEAEKVPGKIYRYIMKNITCIFAISHYLEKKANSFGCKTVVYVPAFVDTNLFKIDKAARDKLRNNWDVNDDEIIIGYAGSLAYKAGIHILLHSLNNLSKRYPKLLLFILGTKQVPNEGNEIFHLIKELGLENKVVFIPPVPHEEVPKFLSACDVLCSPQIDCEINRAANPIKVVEYLSMGIPAICSSVGEVPRIIENGMNGFLTIPGDVENLEVKLEEIILSPERSCEIGRMGRNIAMKKYSYKAVGDMASQVICKTMRTKNDI